MLFLYLFNNFEFAIVKMLLYSKCYVHSNEQNRFNETIQFKKKRTISSPDLSKSVMWLVIVL